MVDANDLRKIPLAEQHAPAALADAFSQQVGASLRWGVPQLQRARRWLQRGLLALIYVPAVGLLLAGVAAAVGLLGGLWRLVRAFTTHALDTVPTTYDRLALAGRVALVSGVFLVLLCALVVVAVGCRGRRWWRLYLIPGVALSAAAALLFIFAVQWLVPAINQRFVWPPDVWQALTALALADAVVVAARIGGIGAGPLGTRRARLRGRLGGSRTAERANERLPSRQTRPIPVVRFGPRDTGVPMPEVPDEASAPAAPGLVGVPTAEELRAAAGSAPVATEEDVAVPIEERDGGAA